MLKCFFLLLISMMSLHSQGQKFTKIFLNLYTDSLKKGTYNYINVDGLLTNGKYLPLDTSEIKFSSNAGTWSGNSLFIDRNFTGEKVNIKIASISQPSVTKDFEMYVKKKPDEILKTSEQLLNEMKGPKVKKKMKVKQQSSPSFN